jgi:adenylate kinase
MQMFELRRFEVSAGTGRQPEVAWRATVRRRSEGTEILVDGHVEIRWSHGRFLGAPEAKVYLDSPLRGVPGYHPLA